MKTQKELKSLEIVEDQGASARRDEGFLRLRRLRCRTTWSDGSRSRSFPVDLIDRESLDAVAVVVYRRGMQGVELLLVDCLRPGAYFRRHRSLPVAGEAPILFLQEIVAGVLEKEDEGLDGVRTRAQAELWEEAGFQISVDKLLPLGAPFFPAAGILSEKIYPFCAEVTGLKGETPCGDGSPLEEGGTLHWWPLDALLQACEQGGLQDAKTELGARRLKARLLEETL